MFESLGLISKNSSNPADLFFKFSYNGLNVAFFNCSFTLAAAEPMESEDSAAAASKSEEKPETKSEEAKPTSEGEKSTSETASAPAPAASAAASLESQMVVGEEFEKTVRGIMDMLGNSRDEVIL